MISENDDVVQHHQFIDSRPQTKSINSNNNNNNKNNKNKRKDIINISTTSTIHIIIYNITTFNITIE